LGGIGGPAFLEPFFVKGGAIFLPLPFIS
jgi:hypothetical protein